MESRIETCIKYAHNNFRKCNKNQNQLGEVKINVKRKFLKRILHFMCKIHQYYYATVSN